MMKTNYQKELEAVLEQQDGSRKLLLHSCCAPCSSYCLEYLKEYFQITVFYYNPNITLSEEYEKRVQEEKRLIRAYNMQIDQADQEGNSFTERMGAPGALKVTKQSRKIDILEGRYEPEKYLEAVKGLEDCPEGGERCRKCFELRLRETARTAAEGGFDFFTTTLTISPLKNAEILNETGRKAAEEYGAVFLPSDFKKKNGYKRSVELSEQFDLYRQNYCGCSFSKAESLERERKLSCDLRQKEI